MTWTITLSPTSRTGAALHSRRTLLLAAAMVAAVQIVLAVSGASPVLDGRLLDPDCYMRLARVATLIEGGSWWDPVMPRSNAPYGEALHWTRPLDLLLVAGALPLEPLLGLKRALLLWGSLVSPLLLVAALPVLSWASRPFLSEGGFLLLCALLLAQPQLSGVFMVGRPDHHGLLALAFLIQMAAVLRLSLGDGGRRAAITAGAAGGLGLWVGVESMIAQLFLAGALALPWIREGGAWAGRLATAMAALAAATALALAVERPPAEWLVEAHTRLSAVHLVLAALGTAAWTGLARVGPRLTSPAARGLATLGAGLAVGLLTALIFPRFQHGPWAEFGGGTGAWLRTISEFQPLWPSDRRRAAQALIQVGPALVALPLALRLAGKGAPGQRRAMAVLLLGLAIYLPLALREMRWVTYVQALALIPWALTLLALFRWEGALTVAGRRMPLRSLAFSGAAAAHLVAGMALQPHPPGVVAGRAPQGEHCAWPALAEWIERTNPAPPGGVLFTYLFTGPEMVWRTGWNVVGAPYANARSLADTAAFFGAREESEARAVAERRGAALVALCPSSIEARDYGPGTLHDRLIRGEPPAWLAPQALPPDLARDFLLFRRE